MVCKNRPSRWFHRRAENASYWFYRVSYSFCAAPSPMFGLYKDSTPPILTEDAVPTIQPESANTEWPQIMKASLFKGQVSYIAYARNCRRGQLRKGRDRG